MIIFDDHLNIIANRAIVNLNQRRNIDAMLGSIRKSDDELLRYAIKTNVLECLRDWNRNRELTPILKFKFERIGDIFPLCIFNVFC